MSTMLQLTKEVKLKKKCFRGTSGQLTIKAGSDETCFRRSNKNKIQKWNEEPMFFKITMLNFSEAMDLKPQCYQHNLLQTLDMMQLNAIAARFSQQHFFKLLHSYFPSRRNCFIGYYNNVVSHLIIWTLSRSNIVSFICAIVCLSLQYILFYLVLSTLKTLAYCSGYFKNTLNKVVFNLSFLFFNIGNSSYAQQWSLHLSQTYWVCTDKLC